MSISIGQYRSNNDMDTDDTERVKRSLSDNYVYIRRTISYSSGESLDHQITMDGYSQFSTYPKAERVNALS